MRELSNYPDGAEHDPRAPWNQSDPEPREYTVTVRVYLKAHEGEESDKQTISDAINSDNYEVLEVTEE